MTYRRVSLERGLGLEALSLLLCIGIDGAFCATCYIFGLVSSNRRAIRIVPRGLCHGTNLYATRRHVSAIKGELSCLSVNAKGNARLLACFYRRFEIQTILRSGEDFSFEYVSSRHVLVRFHTTNLTNCNLSFEGNGRRFFDSTTRFVKFFRKGAEGEACVSNR